LAKLDPNRA